MQVYLSAWERVCQRLGRFLRRRRQVLHFLGLGAVLTATNILANTIAVSLFLTNAGSEALPLFYVLLGLISIPVSVAFSKIIDRYSRVRLFCCLLLLALVLVCGLWWLIRGQTPGIYNGVYISTSIIELLVQVLFWTLVSDYFTNLELERYTPLLTMALTVGSLLGGLLVRVLSESFTTPNLLLGLPFCYGVAIIQLLYLGRTEQPLEIGPLRESETQLLDSLRAFPRLLSRYPIILLLAAGTLISVLLWGMSEFQFYRIYADTFPQQDDLTGFLGLLGAVCSGLELAITYFVTRPLIQRWGVSRMNLVYPLTTLVSFIGLALSFRLPAAIVANINYDTLYSSLAQPIQNLNYGAIPHRFAGRVRVILDGLLYPICQAVAGLVLLLQQAVLTPLQFSLVGVFLSGVFVGIGYLTGQSYLRSMLARLRAGSLNFDEIRVSFRQIPDSYVAEVRQLLTGEDPGGQILGLELAARLPNPSQFLTEVQDLLLRANSEVHRAVVKFLTTGNHPEFYRYLRTQLVSDSEAVRGAVLEALIATQQSLSSTQIIFFLEDPSPRVQALACVATWQTSLRDPQVRAAYEQTWAAFQEAPPEMANRIRRTIVRAIQRTGDRQLMPLLQQVLQGANAEVKREGLQTLARLATSSDHLLSTLAARELLHADPTVRAAAINLLQVLPREDALAPVIASLEDTSAIVRQQATLAIAAYGESCLPLVQPYLTVPRPEVVEAAIAAIGKIRTPRSEAILLQYLQTDYQQVSQTILWSQQVAATVPGWEVLAIALEDYHNLVLRRVLYVLACLEDSQMVSRVQRLLSALDGQTRLNAIETLASLGHRRFIQPILPLLEVITRPAQTPDQPPPELLEQLPELLKIRHRWVRIGALVALAATGREIPPTLVEDPDPLVRLTATKLQSPSLSPLSLEDTPLSRLFFLRKVPLFQNLSLDDLLLVDRSLEEQDFLKGEVIFKEGTWGDNFYILYRGYVSILKRVNPKNVASLTHLLAGEAQRELAYLQPGQYFGDMTLFDELPRSATAIAETDCTLLSLDKTDFYNLITQRPEIALQMCQVLSLRLRDTNKYLEG